MLQTIIRPSMCSGGNHYCLVCSGYLKCTLILDNVVVMSQIGRRGVERDSIGHHSLADVGHSTRGNNVVYLAIDDTVSCDSHRGSGQWSAIVQFAGSLRGHRDLTRVHLQGTESSARGVLVAATVGQCVSETVVHCSVIHILHRSGGSRSHGQRIVLGRRHWDEELQTTTTGHFCASEAVEGHRVAMVSMAITVILILIVTGSNYNSTSVGCHSEGAVLVGDVVVGGHHRAGCVHDDGATRHVVAGADNRLATGNSHGLNGLARCKGRAVDNAVATIRQGGAIIHFLVAVGLDGQRTLVHSQQAISRGRNIVCTAHIHRAMKDGLHSCHVIPGTVIGDTALHVHRDLVSVGQLMDTIGSYIHIVVNTVICVFDLITVLAVLTAVICPCGTVSSDGQIHQCAVCHRQCSRSIVNAVVGGIAGGERVGGDGVCLRTLRRELDTAVDNRGQGVGAQQTVHRVAGLRLHTTVIGKGAVG